MLALKGSRQSISPSRGVSFPFIVSTQQLQRLLQQLSRLPKPHLLDIGPLNGSNIDWLIQQGFKLYVDDCFRPLVKPKAQSEKGIKPHLLSETAQLYPSQFDAILCWDIFDCLTKKQAAELIGKISLLLKPKGLLFAIFNYNPSHPSVLVRHRIVSKMKLEYQAVTTNPLSRRVYENRDIQELLSGLEFVSSCLLQSQIREVLVRKPDKRV